jgi:hypothetical protein
MFDALHEKTVAAGLQFVVRIPITIRGLFKKKTAD